MLNLNQLRRQRLTPASYRRVTLFSVWALGFIILTGAAVRLTGSGLGCRDWPTCSGHQVVSPWQYHAVIEFGNRVVTGAVSIAVIAAVLGSRRRTPRRRDLTWLSWGLVLGVLAQIVLGGQSVKHKLDPPFIMAHFLLSMVLLANAVVLHHRAGYPDDAGPPTPMVSRLLSTAGRLLPVAAASVIALGTVVTGTGPHGGDPSTNGHRLTLFSLHDIARIHSGAVLLFLAFTAVILGSLMRSQAPAEVLRRGELLLAVLLAQGAIGYIQYFSGDQAWLIAIHVSFAAALWAVTLQFALGLRAPTAPPAPPPSEPSPDGRVFATRP